VNAKNNSRHERIADLAEGLTLFIGKVEEYKPILEPGDFFGSKWESQFDEIYSEVSKYVSKDAQDILVLLASDFEDCQKYYHGGRLIPSGTPVGISYRVEDDPIIVIPSMVKLGGE